MNFGLLAPFPAVSFGRRSQLQVDTFLKFIIKSSVPLVETSSTCSVWELCQQLCCIE
jgi:hypothetical protein